MIGKRRGLKFLIKKFRGDQQFEVHVYFKRCPLAKVGKTVK